MAKRPAATDPVTAYARDVLAGRIVAGAPVRKACERHLRDLELGPRRGLVWDVAEVHRIVQFFGFLRLPDSDSPFTLEAFQVFIVGSLAGWKTADGTRRFRHAYIEIAKGNGKTPLAAGVSLYGLVGDGEESAEIYPAATTREQATICFRDVKKMAEASPHLSRVLDISERNIAYHQTRSFLRPVSSEHRGLDGKRVHMAVIDELHEHPTDLVVEKMTANTKGRRQPLIIEITNSGYDRHSICWTHHTYSLRVLEAKTPDDAGFDDSWFAFVCALDEGDDWRDERVWPKANPNLGVSVTVKYLREQVKQALGMPSKENIVKRLNFCIWTEQAVRAIPLDKWRACGRGVDAVEWRKMTIKSLRRRTCWGGLDLGASGDLTALGLVFPAKEEGGPIVLLSYFWVPLVSARRRSERDRVPYDRWLALGFILPTEGDITDYDKVRLDIRELGDHFAIRKIGYDRNFQADQLVQQLGGDGFTMVPFGQGFYSMAAPVRRFLDLVKATGFDHGNNPVLEWMAGNVATEQDAAGCLKWTKEKSIERIDGIVAETMGLAEMMKESGGGSVYDERGVVSV